MQAQLQAGILDFKNLNLNAQILTLVAETAAPPAFFNFISSLVMESSRFPIDPHEARAELASGKHCRRGCPPWVLFSHWRTRRPWGPPTVLRCTGLGAGWWVHRETSPLTLLIRTFSVSMAQGCALASSLVLVSSQRCFDCQVFLTVLTMRRSEVENYLLMKVKEESEKVGLKLKIQKTKIMASGPITSWQIDRMKTVTDFILGGSKITTDVDCSLEIKKHLLLGRKSMANLDSILKSRDSTLPTKVHLVKAYGFSSDHIWMLRVGL